MHRIDLAAFVAGQFQDPFRREGESRLASPLKTSIAAMIDVRNVALLGYVGLGKTGLFRRSRMAG